MMNNNNRGISGPSLSIGAASSTASSTMSGIPNSNNNKSSTYQIPCYLPFVPGGLLYRSNNDSRRKSSKELVLGWLGEEDVHHLPSIVDPNALIRKAMEADEELNRTIARGQQGDKEVFRYPSLSNLAQGVFGSLTGVSASNVRQWADAMVLNSINREQQQGAAAGNNSNNDLLSHLSSLPSVSSTVGARPCGYVFRRGDIAWNCRTCQTDGTCVICDECFRNSNHEGHDVFFHRTSPGGCCDCGDLEAWKAGGCCPKHCSKNAMSTSQEEESEGDVMEAVRASRRGRVEGEEAVRELPEELRSVLGVVIGAAIQCIVEASNGASIGADSDQWWIRWREQVCRILHNVGRREDWYYAHHKTVADSSTFLSPKDILTMKDVVLPSGFRLHLRLHNDDVHTFDEVIDALHDPIPIHTDTDDNEEVSRSSASEGNGQRLVPLKEDADDMTHHVDSDGQVTVRSYTTFHEALFGFKRLKSRGLQCSVVSTPQFDLEMRAKVLLGWLRDLASAHPAISALVVHGLCDVTNGRDTCGSVGVWLHPRQLPVWAGMNAPPDAKNGIRLSAFPPHLDSSYLTREEARTLHRLGGNSPSFQARVATDEAFYDHLVPHIPSRSLRKSPHALWGTLAIPVQAPFHPVYTSNVLSSSSTNTAFQLSDSYMIIDTDLRKQQEAFRLTSSLHPHCIAGLHTISGVALGDVPPPSLATLSTKLASASYRAPFSSILLLLILDPYPPKHLRAALHSLFLSLLVDPRFRARFAAALGGVAYRPLSTLFCAGVGTEADTPLGFTVQIFTAGSVVRALNYPPATACLLQCDDVDVPTAARGYNASSSFTTTFTLPIASSIVRVVHTNLLGATKEVKMVVKNTSASSAPSLTYQSTEHPLTTLLPAAPDDGFLDSRTTRHKRIPHLLRDLEYVLMTPGTAMKLIQATDLPPIPSSLQSDDQHRNSTVFDFSTVWSRMLRLGMGMDPQKRKISGGHVEFEQSRWVEAFGLVLNFAGTRDVLMVATTSGVYDDKVVMGVGNILSALLREMKLWLFREGLLETGFPMPVLQQANLGPLEPYQRSTLHWNAPSGSTSVNLPGGLNNVALSCAAGVKLTEIQLELIEYAIKNEEEDYQEKQNNRRNSLTDDKGFPSCRGALLGDWLRVPHSPLMGDSLTFYLPLYRAFARCIKSYCSIVVPDSVRNAHPRKWWKIPAIDEINYSDPNAPMPCPSADVAIASNPIASLLRGSLRSSNCRAVWSSGPDCSAGQAQVRRSRCRAVAAAIASAKVVHSLCDHPLRCLAASQQIERHLWARNGSAASGMAFNYASSPICCTFRDLDLTLVQLSAAGFNIGLGPRRTLSLIMSRFSMDGYLCDPMKRSGSASPTLATSQITSGGWVHPPRLQDPDHAVALAEAFFTTICLLVTELPGPPPCSLDDDSGMRRTMRRELLHALAAEPRSYSEALAAASIGIQRKEKNESFRLVFSSILKEIGKEKRGANKSRAGPPTYELSAEASEEYDPTFFHLRRFEHQHAMDTIARLRKQKSSTSSGASSGKNTQKCLPLVCSPPPAHTRFLPCRLILHLAAMDAALRRALLFALLAGQWLPPTEVIPSYSDDSSVIGPSNSADSDAGSGKSTSSSHKVRRGYHRSMSSSFNKNKSGQGGAAGGSGAPFGPSVVASSSVSFIEVLQVLTLQIHTLEECASLHQTHDMEEESRHLSASLSINSYLSRFIHVPASLEDCWALRCPEPLPSAGTGSHRGSTLGLLIALYEHRNDHGTVSSDKDDDSSGGARNLAADGLKWLLRFVGALVDGASSVSAASHSATSGTPIRGTSACATSWSISHSVRAAIKGMLSNLPDLWPKEYFPKDALSNSSSPATNSGPIKSNPNLAARKAAQLRAMEKMRKQQASFAASIEATASADGEDGKKMSDSSPGSASFDDFDMDPMEDEEEDLCIICRCNDTDEHTNGPLGFLGHIQRSRVLQVRNSAEIGGYDDKFFMASRVVGDKGCQLRTSEELDSAPVACLPTGSVVMIISSRVSPKYDLLSRRVLVRHESSSTPPKVTEGWASIQSSQGYVILSPLSKLSYNYTRWGATRPILRQCGHAAHLGCVEAHCLSLHQRSAGDQPYDGRFAANIDEGEFLCPLCKQLSNVLVPKGWNWGLMPRAAAMWKKQSPVYGSHSSTGDEQGPQDKITIQASRSDNNSITHLRKLLVEGMQNSFDDYYSMGPKLSSALSKLEKEREGIRRFGAQLIQAMQASWEKTSNQKLRNKRLHPALSKWDYEEDGSYSTDIPMGGDVASSTETSGLSIGKLLRLLRQQHIAWSAVGFGAAVAEASVRGIAPTREAKNTATSSTPSLIVADPWIGYDSESRDSHPMLLELRRILTATSSLLDVLNFEMMEQLHPVEEHFATSSESSPSINKGVSLIGNLFGNILEGVSYLEIGSSEIREEWRALMPFISSMPCHVSRDGCLPQRHEARGTAAAMWASKGLGTSTSANITAPSPGIMSTSVLDNGLRRKKNRTSNAASGIEASLPPTPLAVHRVCSTSNVTSAIDSKEGESNSATKLASYPRPPMLFHSWGTMDPMDVSPSDPKPFRPAIASSFLYIPILAWDLNTFAGALYSSILLHNDVDYVIQSEDLLLATRVLLTARLIQILITPYGIPNSNDNHQVMDGNEFFLQSCDGDESFWSNETIKSEGLALLQLREFCLKAVNRLNGNKDDKKHPSKIDSPEILRDASLALLPFARSLVLMLRACSSTLRQRHRHIRRYKKSASGSDKPSPCDRKLDSVLENPSIMSYADGFHIVSLLGCPLPSSLNGHNDTNPLTKVIPKWLSALVSMEDYHGSLGRGLVYDNKADCWVPSFAVGKDYILNTNVNSSTALLPGVSGQHTMTSTGYSANDNISSPTSVEVVESISTPIPQNSELCMSVNMEDQLGSISNNEDDNSDNNNRYEHNPENNAAYDVEMEDMDNTHVDINNIRAHENQNQGFEGRLFDLLQNQAIIDLNDHSLDSDEDEAEMSEDDDDEAIILNDNNVVLEDDESDDIDDEDGAMFLGMSASNVRSASRASLSSDLQYHGVSDEDSSVSSSCFGKEEDITSDNNASSNPDREFAALSRASIIPYQPSLIGQSIGPGPRGVFFEYSLANLVMSDLSHLGMVHRLDGSHSGLARLPLSFVELYSLVNKVKGRDNGGSACGLMEDNDDGSSSETAICLITGAIMRSGSARRHMFSRGQARPPGACTVHSRKYGSGIGIFFLIQKCTVLLIHNNKSAYSASLYVDEHGEEDPGLRRGRPLFLKEARYAALETLWRQHGIPREVAQIRSTSDRVIRDNWY